MANDTMFQCVYSNFANEAKLKQNNKNKGEKRRKEKKRNEEKGARDVLTVHVNLNRS